MKIKKAVFFDLDQTLINTISATKFATYLFKDEKLISNKVFIHTLLSFLKYKFSIVSDYDSLKRKSTKLGLEGMNAELVHQLFDTFFDDYLNKCLYQDAMKLIDEFRANDFKLYIISSSYDFIVKKFCDFLEFDNYRATTLETKNGFYTGNITGEIYYGKNKASIIKEISINENVDLLKSYAYADNYLDEYILSTVGNPVAVNPERKLRNIAMKNKWSIVKWF